MDPAPRIAAVGRALPPHRATQAELVRALRELWAREHFNVDRLEQLHQAVRVGARNLALPVDEYAKLTGFAARNDAWIRVGLDVGEAALRRALDGAGLAPRDLDHLYFVTVTGLATPSLDARLVDRLGLRGDVKRTPTFGWGCVGGAAGVARASDYLRAFPGETAAVLSVELCSLTWQQADLSVANVIATGLFGDGAACAILRGGDTDGKGPRVVATRSVFFPGTERVMGWDVVDTGFKVVLSAEVPAMVGRAVSDIDAFLAEHGLARRDVKHWVAHTGGPRVLEACEKALGLDGRALARSWASLREVGNLSSASVLFVLGDLLDGRDARAGDHGVLFAMGPGFCAELVLLRW